MRKKIAALTGFVLARIPGRAVYVDKNAFHCPDKKNFQFAFFLRRVSGRDSAPNRGSDYKSCFIWGSTSQMSNSWTVGYAKYNE